ncbi:MAG TPA: putative sugar O-methyltransferase, partial [Flavobacteriales bacterium]|nr:putative sugar O-methyltransferase [Flavobacteriales bacterium]
MWTCPQHKQRNYFNAVERGLSEEHYYQWFKEDINYKEIVGMGAAWQAESHYNYIKEHRPDILNEIGKYQQNDSLGGPKLWSAPTGTQLSPNTLRYIYTTITIDNFFRFKKPIKVIELGVGYGGLCHTMNQHYDIEEYKLVDVPCVEVFATKYLN